MSSGGFILSPSASSVRSSSTGTATSLPHPRPTPLKPGSSKESTFIRYVDQQILHIQRRFAKRTSPMTPSPNQSDYAHGAQVDGDKDRSTFGNSWATDARGYQSMKEACTDIDDVVGVCWVSGTPSLQVPYLINLASLLSSVISGMPPAPKSLFQCLGKLDHCFASLIQGRDIETDQQLPSFFGQKVMSDTEKVRIRSLVERTRVAIVEAFKKGEFEEESGGEMQQSGDDEDVDMDTDGELVLEGSLSRFGEEEEDSIDMQLARVYDRTIQELGGSLEGPGIGVLTEGRG
ncbi:hypothetical protein LTR62_003125 [Meristemomyces frigidus]|uniref:Uncharacterized protein n=1 Tax=Meristemomyces frigidus TaxID=1508187 RepID=A0AAN7TJ68_9PEZI|nr:hypothetical protein LTR62_003125 [Meristemomyces frigidus]